MSDIDDTGRRERQREFTRKWRESQRGRALHLWLHRCDLQQLCNDREEDIRGVSERLYEAIMRVIDLIPPPPVPRVASRYTEFAGMVMSRPDGAQVDEMFLAHKIGLREGTDLARKAWRNMSDKPWIALDMSGDRWIVWGYGDTPPAAWPGPAWHQSRPGRPRKPVEESPATAEDSPARL